MLCRHRALLVTVIAGMLACAQSAVAQDAAAGKALFSQCVVCHSMDGTNRVGPTLKDVFGRKAGAVAGFRYSRAMKSAKLTWDERTLDAYLADPQQVVPGNLMPFSGLADTIPRANLIAYLQTLK